MTTSAAGLGAAAIEALRAATLAAHHAAGLCRSAQFFNAARTARTGEALLRSATALAGVQASSGAPCAQRPCPRQPRHPRGPRTTHGDNGEAEDSVIEPCASSRARKTKRGKKRKKEKDCPPDGVPFCASGMIDDSWADQVGDGVPPHVLADAAPFPASTPASSGGPGRVLAQRVSRERTPPPRSQKQIAVGDFVKIKGLERRTELNGTCGSVIECAADGRFAVQLVSSERIRAKESNLTLMPGCEASILPTASTGSPPSSS
jgi:hypothetical protein